jgi:hypothetical protein
VQWVRAASSHFPYSSLREHQSGILSRRDFKGTLAPHTLLVWLFRGAHDLYFVRKTLLAQSAQGVCLVINRANQSITALIMASVDRPHMSPAAMINAR